MSVLETVAEAAFGRRIKSWADDNGIALSYIKMADSRGWPDRLVIWGPPANMLWIEWKRRGEGPRPLQKYIHQQLRSMGHDVRVYDDWGLALAEVQAKIQSTI